ncbi:MAG: hypothetical protein NT095_01475, partial [Burkholderiales bacterium]|nr:hypothetical protein [Burkholderiales bacterium]
MAIKHQVNVSDLEEVLKAIQQNSDIAETGRNRMSPATWPNGLPHNHPIHTTLRYPCPVTPIPISIRW